MMYRTESIPKVGKKHTLGIAPPAVELVKLHRHVIEARPRCWFESSRPGRRRHGRHHKASCAAHLSPARVRSGPRQPSDLRNRVYFPRTSCTARRP